VLFRFGIPNEGLLSSETQISRRAAKRCAAIGIYWADIVRLESWAGFWVKVAFEGKPNRLSTGSKLSEPGREPNDQKGVESKPAECGRLGLLPAPALVRFSAPEGSLTRPRNSCTEKAKRG
jgi:hypothetical protein